MRIRYEKTALYKKKKSSKLWGYGKLGIDKLRPKCFFCGKLNTGPEKCI
jgi:hypothetical protein